MGSWDVESQGLWVDSKRFAILISTINYETIQNIIINSVNNKVYKYLSFVYSNGKPTMAFIMHFIF